MSKPLFIGLGHKKRTGKDTFAQMLSASLEFKGARVAIKSFARPLKEQAAQIYGWAGLEVPEVYEQKATAYLREVPLPALGGKTPRQIWIEFGMKMREIYADTWLDIVMHAEDNIDHDVVIIPDTRFPNECFGIQKRGGLLYRVLNDGITPTDDVADCALDDYSNLWVDDIHNNGSLSDLSDRAVSLADEIWSTVL